MTNPSNKPWAKLIAMNPDKDDIHLLSRSVEPDEGQIKNGCHIYQKPTGDTWIRNVSVSPIKIGAQWLETNEEKEIFDDKRISLNKDKENDDDNFDYVFFLMNSHSKNLNKRNRTESMEPSSILPSPDTTKLVKLGNDLEEKLACSICMKIFHKCVALKPCLHSFCSVCLLKSLKSSVNCPLCRTKGTSVKKNLIVQDLVGVTLENFPGKERPKEDFEQRNAELEGKIVTWIDKRKNWTYIGDYLDGKREGKGTLILPDGKICRGIWLNDAIETITEIRTDEGVYEGETEKFEMHGKGVFKWNDGDIYQGEFVRGAQEGRGILKGSNGVFYDGEWKNDMKHGNGVGVFEDGNRYEGSWVKNDCYGKGQFTWTDGRKYEGNWKEGFRHGTGTMKLPDGRIYEGQWEKGNQKGKGVLTLSNGDKYEGTWAKDVLQSVKKVYYANGDIYEGGIELENLQRHGEGVMTFRNGDRYKGNWLNDKQHGEGRETRRDGKEIFDGAWEEGKMIGEVIMTDANGKRYKAEWKEIEE